MSFAWGHTTYALWHGMVFHFEDKWDLDYFLAHADGAVRISFNEAYDNFDCRRFIKIFSSRALGRNKHRANKVKEWKYYGRA